MVEESYADCAGLRVPAVAQAPVVLLRAAGFSTSDTDTKQVRSELRVSVRGRSIAHSYGSSARFTGAAVKGSCSIRSGDISHASSFEGKIDRYDVDNWLLEDRYLLPREAPFGEAIARSGYIGAIVKAMSRAWGTDPLPVLIVALQDNNEDLHTGAADALAELGPRALEPLVSWLPRLRLRSQRRAAGCALGRMGERALRPLLRALRGQDAQVREAAAVGLAKLKNPEAVGALIAALTGEKVLVRLAAIEALGRIKDPKAVEPLAAILKEEGPDWRLPHRAVNALGAIGRPAVPVLIEGLDSPDSFLQARVARTLGDIADSRAVEPLGRLLRHSDWSVRHSAIDSLAVIDDPRATVALIGLCPNCPERSRNTLERALAKKGEAAIPALERVLAGGCVDAKRSAARALRFMGGESAMEALIAIWRDEHDGKVHLAACVALQMIGKAAVPQLIRALKDSSWRVRAEAAGTLGTIGDKRAVPHLARIAAADSDVRVQLSARSALREIQRAESANDSQPEPTRR